jgi:hypothetical protein
MFLFFCSRCKITIYIRNGKVKTNKTSLNREVFPLHSTIFPPQGKNFLSEEEKVPDRAGEKSGV